MILLLAYIVGGLLSWFPFSRAILRSVIDTGTPETFDYAAAVMFGAVAAFFWPLGWLLGGATAVLKRQAQAVESTEVPPHDTSMW